MFRFIFIRQKFSFCKPNSLDFEMCNYLVDWHFLSGRCFDISNNAGWSYISFTFIFPEGIPLKKQWAKFFPKLINKYSNWLTIIENIQTFQTSEKLKSTFGFQKTHFRNEILIVCKNRIAIGAGKNQALLIWQYKFNNLELSQCRLRSVSLSTVHSTQMFSSSSGLHYGDPAVLIEEALVHFLRAMEGKSRKTNSVVKRIVLQELLILNKPWKWLQCLDQQLIWAKEDVISHYYTPCKWLNVLLMWWRYDWWLRKSEQHGDTCRFPTDKKKHRVICDRSCWGKWKLEVSISSHSNTRRMQWIIFMN